nr:uncharacterized protein LOC116148876 [Camelus dromedarius]
MSVQENNSPDGNYSIQSFEDRFQAAAPSAEPGSASFSGVRCETTSRNWSEGRVCGELGWPHLWAPALSFGTRAGAGAGVWGLLPSGRRDPRACPARGWGFLRAWTCAPGISLLRAPQTRGSPGPDVSPQSLGSAHVRDQKNGWSCVITKVKLFGFTDGQRGPSPLSTAENCQSLSGLQTRSRETSLPRQAPSGSVTTAHTAASEARDARASHSPAHAECGARRPRSEPTSHPPRRPFSPRAGPKPGGREPREAPRV